MLMAEDRVNDLAREWKAVPDPDKPASESKVPFTDISNKTASDDQQAVVVKTFPEAGTPDVDHNITEIKVTFNKDMKDKSWSWCTTGKDAFPEINGKPYYMNDKQTCVLPVHLKARMKYAIWINTTTYKNFRDANGNPSIPYLLEFKTKQ